MNTTCGATCTCGCCDGLEPITPRRILNRPGLEELSYRVGTYPTFLETMLARLSVLRMPSPENGASDNQKALLPLQPLKTRALDDTAIAWLDSWAVIAEVLTFYQERIANEGYLRTANERRSILELANLVGYQLRPGVAASVYLAFNLDKDQNATIPKGIRSQSVPNPGELPQSFETSEALEARFVWNALRPRMSQPQKIIAGQVPANLYFKGIANNLKVNDQLVIEFANGSAERASVLEVEIDAKADRTRARIQSKRSDASGSDKNAYQRLVELLNDLEKNPSQQPANRPSLIRALAQIFTGRADLAAQMLQKLRSLQGPKLYEALSRILADLPQARVYVMRTTAAVFGHTAQKNPDHTKPMSQWADWPAATDEEPNQVFLDRAYDQIVAGDQSYVILQKSDGSKHLFKIDAVTTVSRNQYGSIGPSTRLSWTDPANTWNPKGATTLDLLRGTKFFTQGELLLLSEAPITEDDGETLKPIEKSEILLSDLYDGLKPGRWLFISGERVDAPGVQASELVMLAGAEQVLDVNLPGDTTHTLITLANDLAYKYKRDTVTINANVVHATHGETRSEVLGSGDGAKELQAFRLSQAPVTYTAAVTRSGIANTLEVRVNDVLWQEVDSFVDKQANDRIYVTRKDDEGKTSVVFGNGRQGARLPTGNENIKALFRLGIGAAGNVKARQISLLATRPVGVKEVINPAPATGGADPETRDQARRNATRELRALDRAVSVQDYADFARAFAGIGKAAATRLADGVREFVHLTITGDNDIPIDVQSDLYRSLLQALRRFGDPHQPLEVQTRELKLLIIVANVRLLPAYLWEFVEPKIRAMMLDTFGFARRDLGQDVLQSEVIAALQNVEGVDYVDLDKFDAIDPETILAKLTDFSSFVNELGLQPRVAANAAYIDRTTSDSAKRLRPGQIALLSPDLPDTLKLNLI